MKTTWENVELFEELVACFAGATYGVAVDSCTNAIFLSLKYYHDMIANDVLDNTLVVPSRTYISVPMQCKHAGFDVVFEDIKWEGSYNFRGLPVIDSAQRFERNMHIPGSVRCLSFNFKKILSCGKGGMILTDSQIMRDWLVRMRYDGRSTEKYGDINNVTVPEIGYHMYMTPETAVRGIEAFYRLLEHENKMCGVSGRSSDYGIDLSTLDCFK
jgi:dTDP-4-amino-4,6-dideoxygalactose transaminase